MLNSPTRSSTTAANVWAPTIMAVSPERLRDRSWGEVKNGDTVNFRTFVPAKDGLFCERIFGPVKDYECQCGRFKGIDRARVRCRKCGVQVISSAVRRERFGHVELAVQIVPTRFIESISAVLGRHPSELLPVIGYRSYVVTDPGESELDFAQILDQQEYERAVEAFGYGTFEVGMGGGAIQHLLAMVELPALATELRESVHHEGSESRRRTDLARLDVIDALVDRKSAPEWMVLTVLPVLPPDRRPLLRLEDGRWVSSPMNKLYRRLIFMNERIKMLRGLNATELMMRAENRALQNAADAVFEKFRWTRSTKPETPP